LKTIPHNVVEVEVEEEVVVEMEMEVEVEEEGRGRWVGEGGPLHFEAVFGSGHVVGGRLECDLQRRSGGLAAAAGGARV
jgi:hypothetical protein